MAIEGPLKELGIHDVFQLLDLSRKTGKLTVTSKLRHNRGSVFFEDGSIVYAEIESNPHLLGGLLLRSGKINDADLKRARDMQKQGDERRLGTILLDLGAVSLKELERHVRTQVEEVVFELVGWREGFFSFEEGDCYVLHADACVGIPTESLLMEGARRIDEWSRIERKIPHLGVIPGFAPVTASDMKRNLDLVPLEWEVLTVVDAEADIKSIAASLGRSEFDVAKAVFGLETAGILEIREQVAEPEVVVSDTSQPAPELIERAEKALKVGDFDTARVWAEKACGAHPHVAEVHFALGRIDLAEKRPADAEEHLRRALRIDPLLADAHRFLGDALALLGRYTDAVEWWQRWLTVSEQTQQDDKEVERVKEALRTVEKLDLLLGRTSG